MKNPIASLFRSVVEFFRPTHRISREQSLTPEQFRRMLAELLAAELDLAWRFFQPLAGTIYPFVGGMPAVDTPGGIANNLAKFTDADTIDDSQVFDNGTNVGIWTTTPSAKLDVNNTIRALSNSVSAPATGKGLEMYYNGALDYGIVLSFDRTGGAYKPLLMNGSVLVFVIGATEKMRIDGLGNVGIGTTSPQSKLNVKGSASFAASGTVSITNGSKTVTGSGTSFMTQVGVGDRISVTTGGNTYTRTVTAIPSNTSLTVDATFTVTASSLTMTVKPSLLRCEDSSGNRKLVVDDDGFVGLAGTAINDNDGVGYVICNADKTFVDPNNNNEMRGYQATLRYTRNNSADASNVYSRVNTLGTAVTWIAGEQFRTGVVWNGLRIDITDANGITTSYVISSVTDATHLTLTTSAGTQTDVESAVWQTTKTGGRAGDGWDVFGYAGAVEAKNMALPNVGNVNTSGTAVTWVSGAKFFWATVGQHININGTDYIIAAFASDTSLTLQTSAGTQNNVVYADVNIRGQMKPFQSELYFRSPASGGKNYHVEAPAINYVASLTRVEPSCSIKTWAGVVIDSPCSECGSANAVETGYGVWVQDLQDGVSTLQAANAAAIKIDGLGTYGRILWGTVGVANASVYYPSSGVLEFHATTMVQTASGVNFNVGGGYRVGGTEVISSSRNIANVGTVTTSGAVSTGGGITVGSGGSQGVNAGSYAISGVTLIDSSKNVSTTGFGNFASLLIGGTQVIDSSRGLTNVQGASVNDAASPGSGAFQVGSSFSGSPKISMNTSNGNIGTLGVVNAVNGFQFNSTPGATGTFLDQNGNTVHVNGGIITSLT